MGAYFNSIIMFRDLKQNQHVYLLRRNDGLHASEGKVISVSPPHIDPTKIGSVNQMLIDVTIEENGKTKMYQTPDNLSVAYCDNNELTISSDRDCFVREVESIKSQALDSVDRNKATIQQADKILSEYSPAFKEKRESDERLSRMENTILAQNKSIDEIKTMITKLTTAQRI